jgi:Tol biopolymer transport system component
MGEVYRARDTTLDRDVAIKVLPEAFAHDAERLARFLREAKTLAALNHPNIAAIYGLEDADGTKALVMELVEGEDLSQRIARGAIPVEEALPLATQIAEALEAAHEQGIIHRDLKPANIKVRPDGTVKVLDFGLARALEPAGALAVSASMAPTITTPAMTQAGMILGTAAYMAPEQARGKAVDKRADIWAFGCVLYEMLTGQRAFGAAGDGISDTIAAILRAEPDWSALPVATPAGVRRLLRRCLAKDTRDRLRDAADARFDLDEALSAPVPASSGLDTAAAPRTARRTMWRPAAAILVTVAVLAVPATRHLLEQPATRQVRRLDLAVPAITDPLSVAISPDGRYLAFVAAGEDGVEPQLWIRALDETAARPLRGTGGAAYPFWSPDSQAIGFFAEAKLKQIDLRGGGPQTIADAAAAAPRGATWNSDGTIVFSESNRLASVAVRGGSPTGLTMLGPGQTSQRWPQFLPDGRRFLFHVLGGSPEVTGIYLGTLDGKEPVRLTPDNTAAVFVSQGRLLVVRQETLMSLPFDPVRAVVTGDPVPVAQMVTANVSQGRAILTASDTGVIVYGAGSASQRRQFTWRDRAGQMIGTVVDAGDTDAPSMVLSPDGQRIITSLTQQGNQDIWAIDLMRGLPSRLTFNIARDNAPVWSADGQHVVFRSGRVGPYDLYEKLATGAGDERVLLATPDIKAPYDSSPDGKTLLYGVLSSKTGADIMALPLVGEAKPFPVVQTGFAEDSAQFSPDGRWVAYESNESGRFEIYVVGFPTPQGKWQVSIGGGTFPRWRKDGRELFYIGTDGHLMAAPFTVATDAQSVETGRPVSLFTPRFATGGAILSPGALARPLYAVAADGRFLINEVTDAANGDQTVLTVVLDWDEAQQTR